MWQGRDEWKEKEIHGKGGKGKKSPREGIEQWKGMAIKSDV